LFPALFSFSKHAFGYMALGSYKDATEGTDIAICSQGHEDEFLLYIYVEVKDAIYSK